VISQGSVATCLRFGGIVNDRCIANFLVKDFLNRSIFSIVMDNSSLRCLPFCHGIFTNFITVQHVISLARVFLATSKFTELKKFPNLSHSVADEQGERAWKIARLSASVNGHPHLP